MKSLTNHQHLLNKHHELDYHCRNPGNRIFVSDWYCKHPYVRKYIPQDIFTENHLTDQDLLYYTFPNDEFSVHNEIRKFHQKHDGIIYENEEIYIGAGMTPLITAQVIMMLSMGYKEFYYTKPLYYTFYYLSQVFNFKLIPVCDVPLNKPGIKLNLPEKKICLIVCDPLWYMGKAIVPEYMEQIKKWQNRTKSYVLVDGAFQYMKWDIKDRKESSAILDKNLTFRSICPTKALAIHGIRFSYTLLPKIHQEDMRYAYANTSGSACIYSHKAAKRIMEVLNSEESNSELMKHIQKRYKHFINKKVFIDDIKAEMTYFIFVKMTGEKSKYIAMDQDFFDTTNYPGYVRFNLLLPHKI